MPEYAAIEEAPGYQSQGPKLVNEAFLAAGRMIV